MASTGRGNERTGRGHKQTQNTKLSYRKRRHKVNDSICVHGEKGSQSYLFKVLQVTSLWCSILVVPIRTLAAAFGHLNNEQWEQSSPEGTHAHTSFSALIKVGLFQISTTSCRWKSGQRNLFYVWVDGRILVTNNSTVPHSSTGGQARAIQSNHMLRLLSFLRCSVSKDNISSFVWF